MPNDGPQHNLVPKAEEKKLFFVLCLTALIMFVEVLGGYFSGSLALLADAGHMFTDVAALLLSWLAMRLGRKAPDEERTYGYQRLKILAAYTNAVLLFFLSAIIISEAIDRIYRPREHIDGQLMLIVALVGLVTNVVSIFILNNHTGTSPDLLGHSHSHDHSHDHGHSHADHSHDHKHGNKKEGHSHDLNVQGALIHVISDMLGSAAAVGAALLIIFYDWKLADPILSIVVSLLILGYAWRLAKQTVHILIEGSPDASLPDKIKETILAHVKGVKDVHHVHVWSLTEKQPIATLDVTIDENADYHTTLCAIRKVLLDEHELDHVTIQIEKGPCFGL
jgi:cobalt-zinc-cadmium efflux system protein